MESYLNYGVEEGHTEPPVETEKLLPPDVVDDDSALNDLTERQYADDQEMMLPPYVK
jgi:hypothetical protein